MHKKCLENLGLSLDAKIYSDGHFEYNVRTTVRTPMGTLESVCSPFVVQQDHVADAQVSRFAVRNPSGPFCKC